MNRRRRQAVKLWCASGLLPVGVCLVAVAAETGWVGPSVAGYVCLLLVPPLVVDVVVDRLDQRIGAALRAEQGGYIVVTQTPPGFADELRDELRRRQEATARPADGPPAGGGG